MKQRFKSEPSKRAHRHNPNWTKGAVSGVKASKAEREKNKQLLLQTMAEAASKRAGVPYEVRDGRIMLVRDDEGGS